MTPEEFAERMQRIKERIGGDPECAHAAADDLMCEALHEEGFADGVRTFKDIEKWYA